jgi:hypothetical protein
VSNVVRERKNMDSRFSTRSERSLQIARARAARTDGINSINRNARIKMSSTAGEERTAIKG